MVTRQRGFWLLAMLLPSILGGCGGSMVSRTDFAGAPDAVPRVEPKSKYGNMDSYVVFGKRYYTKASSRNFVEKGTASWYGDQFHGRRTSSGESYNMYQMTAAHKTLPLPTYARVTNLENGRSTVVRINDRGPFHDDRVIDLSFAAAHKLGVVPTGTARVEVRSIDPRDHGGRVPNSERRRARRTAPPAAQVAAVEVTRPAPAARPARARAAQAPAPKPEIAERAPAPAAKSAVDSGSAYYVQVGAFGSKLNADQLRHRLIGTLPEPVQVSLGLGANAAVYKVRVGPLDSPARAASLSRRLADLGLTPGYVVAE